MPTFIKKIVAGPSWDQVNEFFFRLESRDEHVADPGFVLEDEAGMQFPLGKIEFRREDVKRYRDLDKAETVDPEKDYPNCILINAFSLDFRRRVTIIYIVDKNKGSCIIMSAEKK